MKKLASSVYQNLRINICQESGSNTHDAIHNMLTVVFPYNNEPEISVYTKEPPSSQILAQDYAVVPCVF